MNMFQELDYLIELIFETYINISHSWGKNNEHRLFNLKKKCISGIRDNPALFNLNWAYRDFITLNEEIIHFIFLLGQLKQIINTRIKTRNSIEYKIENYLLSHENGKVPINKCLNDLFGIRMILSDDPTHEEIRKHIIEKYPALRCIDSSKNDYTATHVYFRDDNYSFPWELQIWKIRDKDNNIKSHKKYKQDYTGWERQSKGGF